VSDHSTTQCLLFPDIFHKPAVLQFDQRQGSSDGGALLLKAADRRYGLSGCLAGCLRDERQAGKVDHSLKELLAQRVFAIACGYPDANDAARLAADPIHKRLLDRDPGAGRDLASQPTLSRFENALGAKELFRLSEALAASVMQRHAERLRGRVRRVTLDLDPTDDPTHGAQQLSFFNRWIKELHELQIDRTSCSDFWANQFRVLLTAAAYVLMQELRLRAAGTDCARAQVWTLRERLLKLGARVLVSVRRVMVHLPASFPFLPTFRRVALALGASPG
jgi:Transposase DDE domain group 1